MPGLWARSALVSHLKMQGIGNSPGTSFRIPDAEIFLYTGIENASDASYDQAIMDLSACSGELSQCDSTNSLYSKKAGSVSDAARRLKSLLQWPLRKEKKASKRESRDDNSLESFSICRNLDDSLIPLRQKYSTLSSFPNNKRHFLLGVIFQAHPPKRNLQWDSCKVLLRQCHIYLVQRGHLQVCQDHRCLHLIQWINKRVLTLLDPLAQHCHLVVKHHK
jgi:hypothetical protein